MSAVLLVDDNTDLLELFTFVLRDAGYDVQTARDGIEGLEVLRSCSTLPDAIVLDVEMPRMNGPEMIRQLRICKGGEEKIPVLLISAMHRPEFLKLIHQLQIRHSLSKPFDSDELLAAVASITAGPRPVLRRTRA
jgi:chemosensory pili system protein ChpA (sensor histidine kinase/response regulator)